MQKRPGYLPPACMWLCLTQCRLRALPHMQCSCHAQSSRISAGVRAAPSTTGCGMNPPDLQSHMPQWHLNTRAVDPAEFVAHCRLHLRPICNGDRQQLPAHGVADCRGLIAGQHAAAAARLHTNARVPRSGGHSAHRKDAAPLTGRGSALSS